jgi:hypothetical protein
MRATRYANYLSPLVLLLSSTSALAATTINGSTTAPLKTSTAGDVTVADGGTITVSGVPAVTVDSNNNVTISSGSTGGSLVGSNANNSGGILVNAGLTSTISNAGKISAPENYTVGVITGTTTAAGPIANTTGRYGIWVNGAGSGTITNTGSIIVKGLGPSASNPNGVAAGILVSGPYSGSITNAGTISVTGDNSAGVSVQSVTGGLAVGGTVTAVGQGAQDVIAAGDIGGPLTLQGTISQGTSYTTDSATTQTLSAAALSTGKAAIEVDGNVLGGILVYAPCSATTVNNVASCTSSNATTTTGAITSAGNSPALQIGGANNIVIGANAPSINGNSYSLVVDGSVTATAGFGSTNAYGLVVGGKGGTVSLPGGIGVTGTVAATAVDSTATAILINTGSTVPSLINSGTIKATLSQAGGTAAYGIRDLSGSLTSITNNGAISATAGVTSVAVDLSANTTGVTYTQALNAYQTQQQIQEKAASTYTYATRVIYNSTTGDILTGTGNDTIAIQSGTVTGNAYLGGGSDTVALSGDATWAGNITFGTGTGSITMAGTSLWTGALYAADMPTSLVIGGSAKFAALGISGGSLLDVTVNSGGTFGASSSATMNVRSLTINSGGEFSAFVDGTNGVSSLVQAQTATFQSGTKVAAVVSSLSNAQGTYKILSAGTLVGNPSFDATTTDLPVLFKGSVTEQGNDLYLTLARKTAAELGLTSSQAAAYDAIYANALVNSDISNSLLQVADVPTLQAQMNTMLPDHAGGTFDFVSRGNDLVTRHLVDDSSIYHISDVGAWLEPLYFQDNKTETGTAPYKVDGYGVSFGLERRFGANRAGLTFAWIGGKINDGSWDNISANSYQFGAYWRLSKGPIYAFAKAWGEKVSFDSVRTFTGAVNSVALTYVSNGHWSGWAYGGDAGASYKFMVNPRFNLKPMVEFDYTKLDEDSYVETGSTATDLSVASRHSDSLAAVTTVTAGYVFGEQTPDDRPLTLEFEGGWRSMLAGSLGNTTASFNGGNLFTIVPDELRGGWLTELRLLFGGMDYTWKFTARANEAQAGGKPDLAALISFSLAL